ncbi:hypothetical protein RB195_015301 [Necator americanus]|uniref:Integrase core domain protein n=1 Tax=Necator americanus TaxID=51031 RepID=A0ABR1E439_NECAM
MIIVVIVVIVFVMIDILIVLHVVGTLLGNRPVKEVHLAIPLHRTIIPIHHLVDFIYSPYRRHYRDRDYHHQSHRNHFPYRRSERDSERMRHRNQRRHSPSPSLPPYGVRFRANPRDSLSPVRRRNHSSPESSSHVADTDDEMHNALDCRPVDDPTTLTTSSNHQRPLLMTVKAHIRNPKTKTLETVNVMLDSGAQNSFISNAATKRLSLKLYDHKPLTVIGFGGHRSTQESGTVDATLLDAANKPFPVTLRTQEVLTSQFKPYRLSKEDKHALRTFRINSLTISRHVTTDILLGIDYFWENHLTTSPSTPHRSEDDITRLWDLGRLGITEDPDPSVDKEEDTRILERFQDTAQVIDGYLHVQFPWKSSHPRLADNKMLAFKRLQSQYRSFQTKPTLWKTYTATFTDYLEQGIIEEVDEHQFDDHRVYYIPHQAFIKETSATTKLRVVFDASSHYRGAPSLNDCLHSGPAILPDMVGILLRSRSTPYLLIADVEKAFLQIRLQRNQRDATRFLWLRNPNLPPTADNLRIFRFTRVPFGITASPFLLAASILYYLHLEPSKPLHKEIEDNIYVDNILLSASSERQAIKKYRSSKFLFNSMHMNLREFLCNSNTVNQSIEPSDRVRNPSSVKLLGIPWNSRTDTLLIPLKTVSANVYSKRTALTASDCATRGLSTADAVWWHGPSFLCSPQSDWPKADTDFALPQDLCPEAEHEFQALSVLPTQPYESPLRFRATSSYIKLICSTAYVLKFIKALFQKTRIRNYTLNLATVVLSKDVSASEITNAETLLIMEHYRESESTLKRLPLDKYNAHRAADGLILCPNRLDHARTSFQSSAPILLIPEHHFVHLLVMYHHKTRFHSGVHATIAAFRTSYFIPSIKTTITRILRLCTVCRRAQGHAYRYPEMPSLPPERVNRSRPFQKVGLDYLGPLYYRDQLHSQAKIWICLFTCMATRTVHLELVHNNTAFEFLLAFRRFIARRGTPDLIISDNATTFRSANDSLQSTIYNRKAIEKISTQLANRKIEWRFITPFSPWKGGFYERLVGLFKSAFKKAIKHTLLPLSQFQTLVAEIEAVLNSRPLLSISDTSSPPHVLRPIDFVSPQVELQLPSPYHNPLYIPPSRLSEWYKETLAVLNNFWEICPLIPSVGDDKNVPRGQWPLAIITTIHRTKSNIRRSATLRIANGHELQRSINQLHPLEISAKEDPRPKKSRQQLQPLRIQSPRAAKRVRFALGTKRA